MSARAFKRVCVGCLFVSMFVANTGIGQEELEDVVYLNDGSIIRGLIIEQIPNKSIKLQTRDGNVFVFTVDRIQKISKEPLRVKRGRESGFQTQAHFSLVLGGIIYGDFYFGTGARLGAVISPGFYFGILATTHFSEAGSGTLLGGELGYHARLGSVSLEFCGSIGVAIVPGASALFVGPSLGVYFWISPNLAVGPEGKYLYVPDVQDGVGATYVTFRLRI